MTITSSHNIHKIMDTWKQFIDLHSTNKNGFSLPITPKIKVEYNI